MNPSPGSAHLRMFKKAFNNFGYYRLFPAHVANNEIKDMDTSLYVEKRDIHFVHSSEINPSDAEYAVFAKGTNRT